MAHSGPPSGVKWHGRLRGQKLHGCHSPPRRCRCQHKNGMLPEWKSVSREVLKCPVHIPDSRSELVSSPPDNQDTSDKGTHSRRVPCIPTKFIKGAGLHSNSRHTVFVGELNCSGRRLQQQRFATIFEFVSKIIVVFPSSICTQSKGLSHLNRFSRDSAIL